MSTACDVVLVRHAATDANLKKPYVLLGRNTDPPLGDTGQRQAAAVAKALAPYSLSAVYTSPLKRARATADAIASLHGVGVTVVPELIEGDLGEWEGKDWDLVKERWPAEFAAFLEAPDQVPYLGGESYTDVCDRAAPAVAAIARAEIGRSVAIIGHNVVNRALLAHWLGIPLRFARRLPQNNAGFSLIRHDGVNVQVRTINLAAHLDGI